MDRAPHCNQITVSHRCGGKPRLLHTYIYKVIKRVHPDASMATPAMVFVTYLLLSCFDKLVAEACRQTQRPQKRRVVTTNEIEGAVRRVMPEMPWIDAPNGTLQSFCVSEGAKAVTKAVARSLHVPRYGGKAPRPTLEWTRRLL